MTREEAILYMSLYKKKLEVSVSVGLEEDIEAFNTAIKALKQGDTIDKIKAEISGKYRIILKDTPEDNWAVRWNDCLDEVLEVIDKYKEEQEEE